MTMYRMYYFAVHTRRAVYKYLSVAENEETAIKNLATYFSHTPLNEIMFKKTDKGADFSVGEWFCHIDRWNESYWGREIKEQHGVTDPFEKRERVCEMTMC